MSTTLNTPPPGIEKGARVIKADGAIGYVIGIDLLDRRVKVHWKTDASGVPFPNRSLTLWTSWNQVRVENETVVGPGEFLLRGEEVGLVRDLLAARAKEIEDGGWWDFGNRIKTKLRKLLVAQFNELIKKMEG